MILFRKLILFLKRLFKGTLKASSKTITQVTTEVKVADPVEQSKQVQEIAYFTRANNIIDEFPYDPTPVYSSNFSDPNPEPIGWLQASGKITEFKHGGKVIEQENEVLLEDDISKMDESRKHVLKKLEEYREKHKTVNFLDEMKKQQEIYDDTMKKIDEQLNKEECLK